MNRLPARRGAALERIVATLLRATSPSMRIARTLNSGQRAAQATAIAARPSATPIHRMFAVAFIRRTSLGSGAVAADIRFPVLPGR